MWRAQHRHRFPPSGLDRTNAENMLAYVRTYINRPCTTHFDRLRQAWSQGERERERETTHFETSRITEPASKLAAQLHGTEPSLAVLIFTHQHAPGLAVPVLIVIAFSSSNMIKLLAGRSVHFQEKWALSKSCGPFRIPPISNPPSFASFLLELVQLVTSEIRWHLGEPPKWDLVTKQYLNYFTYFQLFSYHFYLLLLRFYCIILIVLPLFHVDRVVSSIFSLNFHVVSCCFQRWHRP